MLTNKIKAQNPYSKYVSFLPAVFLLGIASMRLYPYYQIYVICGLGFIFSASTIWNSNLMFLHSYSWIIGAFVAGFTYYLLAKK